MSVKFLEGWMTDEHEAALSKKSSSIRDDSICESSLPPNKSSGDIVELKPCPFCGRSPTGIVVSQHYAPVCDVICGCGGSMNSCNDEADAIEAWNTRPSLDARMREALELARNRIIFLGFAAGPKHITSNEQDFLPVIDAALSSPVQSGSLSLHRLADRLACAPIIGGAVSISPEDRNTLFELLTVQSGKMGGEG